MKLTQEQVDELLEAAMNDQKSSLTTLQFKAVQSLEQSGQLHLVPAEILRRYHSMTWAMNYILQGKGRHE